MLTWLGAACLAAGMAVEAATVPLSGTVVDIDGHPVAGASVWLGDTHADHKGPQTIATAETDDEGRFRLQRPDDLPARGANSWSPTLWAYKAGFRVGRLELKWGPPKADEPVRLTLGPLASPLSVRVVHVDGSPAAGARVRPIPVIAGIPRPPDEMLDRLTAATDADGWAKLDGFTTDEVNWFDVTLGDDLVQCLMPHARSRTVALRPLGRLSVRLVTEDPGVSIKGWKITATSRWTEANYQGPPTHWRRETTGDDGRVDFQPMAVGGILWAVEAPEGSDYVVAERPSTRIRAGETTETEIKVQRGVRVEGVVRMEPGGAPIPGVKVNANTLGTGYLRNTRPVETDAQGRFSIVVPPGNCRFEYDSRGIPNDYLLPPGTEIWTDFEIKEGEERHEFNPPPLHQAREVTGQVLGANGEPERGVNVSGAWTSANYERRSNSLSTLTDERGEFVLGNIAPGARVEVAANLGFTHNAETVVVPRAGEGGPITIHLRKKPTRALSGRVLDADGQPLADALILVSIRDAHQHSYGGGSVFAFGEGVVVRTDADGRYATPREIPADLVCRVEATAEGWESGSTQWLPPAEADAESEAPDLRLRKAIGLRELTGRVVDSFGNPVAGAEVFQALDEPTWDRSKTDADGRFKLANVPNAPALVFASKEDHQFLGRRVEPGERSVDLVLRSFAEPPPAPLRPVPSPVSRELERTIARELVVAARENAVQADHWLTRSLDEIEAWTDPDRFVAMIENQARAPEPNVLQALALGRSEGDPGAILRFLDAIGAPSTTATVALGIFDRLGSAVRPDFRRELLDRAERSAREIQAPGSNADRLLGIGERWLDLGDADRGAALIHEAQKLMDQEERPQSPSARDGLIRALARVDLPKSLKMLEAREGQRYEIDHLRAEIAKRIASTNLDEAKRLLDAIENRHPVTGRLAVRLQLARTDLEAARALGNEVEDPMTDALLPAIAAKAMAATDPAAARELLRESVERLSNLESFRLNEPAAAAMLARLLPLAARIDPDRAPSYLWLALARRSTAPESIEPSSSTRPSLWALLPQYLGLAELAALVARYDRSAAEVVFEPVAARLGPSVADESWGLGVDGVAAVAAAGAFDARAAKALVDTLPDDPPPPKPGEPGFRRNDKLQARIALARILGLPPALRFRASFRNQQPFNDWVAAIED